MNYLNCEGLTAGYAGASVVRGLDLEVAQGKVLALLGPNGAGKTTILAAIAGLHPRMEGSVRIDGEELTSGRPRHASRAGVVLVPDDRALFRNLTLRENLTLAASNKARVDDTLELFPQLKRRLKVAAGLLSGGEQQMLAIGRALVQEPKALLIDELSMGLAPTIVEELLPIVRDAASERGVAVVLVEQHVALALSAADQAIVLVHGEAVLRGEANDLAASRGLVEAAYLGEHEPAPN
ncbi:MAG: branched-chain amino acid transport system ATP-binding protein [Solirubrobacterales bacterium]|nr:branched-chain amino acid transport system ATP-binding protein [Solirubrobacterales bacterium]